MLTRRQVLTGLANIPIAFREYRSIHDWDENPTIFSLLEIARIEENLQRLAEMAGIETRPTPQCYILIRPLLEEICKDDSPCPEKT